MRKDYSLIEEEALTVLKNLQSIDYAHLDNQMDMQKDDIITDLSFGRLALQIPVQHYELLTMAYPELQNPDSEAKTLAWKRFMETDLSLPYKVNSKQRTM